MVSGDTKSKHSSDSQARIIGEYLVGSAFGLSSGSGDVRQRRKLVSCRTITGRRLPGGGYIFGVTPILTTQSNGTGVASIIVRRTA